MAAFRNDTEQWGELDWSLVQNGWVSLFHSRDRFRSALDWLDEAGYSVFEFDATDSPTVSYALEVIGARLDFPEYARTPNLDGFNDCLSDVGRYDYGSDPSRTGTALAIRRFDLLADRDPQPAHWLLDIIADQARSAMLIGHRMLCLIQSDDGDIELAPVGATGANWNHAEWLRSKRLGQP
jgi:Barstar (barnase inhibitor)